MVICVKVSGGYVSGDGGDGGDKGGVDGVSKMGNWAFEKGIKKTPTLRRVSNMEK